MKKKIVMLFLVFVNLLVVYGKDFKLEKGIKVNQKNHIYSSIYNGVDKRGLVSNWGEGKVIRYSDNDDNSTGLKSFVEIEYEIGYQINGVDYAKDKIILVFFSLKKRLVDENTKINDGTIIAELNADEQGPYFGVFLVTDKDLPILQTLTKNTKIKIDKLWYWDSSFMFTGVSDLSLSGTKWGEALMYYMFVDDKTYKFCLFSPNNVQDKGTYTLVGNVVTFNSTDLKKSWKATITGNKMTRDSGEVYNKQ
ncbi:MAG: hypothetical protein Ta2F_18580 [Termitinemataceae bacterium]|nr:MAG: hypothetical protein Ta2F_18580 [Termitinemataceae bacterium]